MARENQTTHAPKVSSKIDKRKNCLFPLHAKNYDNRWNCIPIKTQNHQSMTHHQHPEIWNSIVYTRETFFKKNLLKKNKKKPNHFHGCNQFLNVPMLCWIRRNFLQSSDIKCLYFYIMRTLLQSQATRMQLYKGCHCKAHNYRHCICACCGSEVENDKYWD